MKKILIISVLFICLLLWAQTPPPPVKRTNTPIAKSIPLNPNLTINLWWNSQTNTGHYEIWENTNLNYPFTFLTNVGMATNKTFITHKDPQQKYYLVKAKNTNLLTRIVWDYNCLTQSDVIAYRVYQGGTSRNYTNVQIVSLCTNKTAILVLNLNAVYYLAVTALDANGLESDFSVELKLTNNPTVSTNFIRSFISAIR